MHSIFPLYKEARIFDLQFDLKREVRLLRGSDSGALAVDAAKERTHGFNKQFEPTLVELGVRHEVWQVAGMFSKEWDERVYYYRKAGPTRGSLLIAIDLTQKGVGGVAKGIGSAIDSVWPD